jgi:pimeloyl-ACP methyl ester carboxylesterase
MTRAKQLLAVCAVISAVAPLYAQPAASWQDPSSHAVRMVSVEQSVALEVLDWGGFGTPVVLLAGGGNTAHVFDEFAPKLTETFRVYGITRRGFGASEFAAVTDPGTRLGDDVLAVIDALELDRPVLVGHSIAGVELSSIAGAHEERIAALIFLEAAFPYAFSGGDSPMMAEFLAAPSSLQPPLPSAADLVSFAALQAWDERQYGVRMPEAELRQTWQSAPAGQPTRPRDFAGSSMFMALLTEPARYASFPVPTLVIFAIPRLREPWIAASPDLRLRSEAESYFARTDALTEQQANAIEAAAPDVRVVRLRGAAHYLFLSNEREVLAEMHAFVTRVR